MADTHTQCRIHKGAVHSFCLKHGIYCCPECHRRSYSACSVLAKDDAISHFQGELTTSASKIHDVMQNCDGLLASLQDKRDSIRYENEAAIDCVMTFCDQLQSTIDCFRQQSLEKIKIMSTERIDRITDQLQTCEDLNTYLNELKETADIKYIPDQAAISTDQITHLNTVTNQLGDGLVSAEFQIGELSSEEIDHSIPIPIDSSINAQLYEQLTGIHESIGKYPEGCTGYTSICRSESSVQSDCANGGPTEGIAATQHSPTERDTPRIFSEHSRFSHSGKNRVVRFAHTPAGLRILISSTDPDQLSIVDEEGRVSITKEMDASIFDMCVRDEQVYATDGEDCNIRVYRLSDLSLVRKITTVDKTFKIFCTDHDIIVSLYIVDINDFIDERVCRISKTGEVTHTSSCEFDTIAGIVEISRGGNIMVSDCDAHTIVILSADLSHITNITGPHIAMPCGLCLVCESVFVSCYGSNSVIELDVYGGYRRIVLGEEDGLEEPHELAYDKETAKLVVSPHNDSDQIIVFFSDS